MADLILLTTVFYVVFLLVVVRRIGILNPAGLFASSTYLMALGTLLNVDPFMEADQTYALIMAYSSVATSLCLTLLLMGPRREPSGRPLVMNAAPATWQWALMIFSAAVVVAYYMAVGYSAFLVGLQGVVSGTDTDVATLRLDSYSSGGYFAPGYVAQFKNAILPALVIVAWASGVHRRNHLAFVVVFVLSAVAIFGLVGTGQRQALAMSVLVVLCFVGQFRVGRSFGSAKTVFVSLGGLLLLLVMTSVLGRSGDIGVASSVTDRLVAAADDVTSRVLEVNQISGIFGFRYVADRELGYPGAEWVQAFLGLTPGNPGSSLASEIFASRYGSDRGTSPISMWGSVNYNFGTAGTLLVPLLFSVVLAHLTRVVVDKGRPRNAVEAAGMAGVSVVLGFWVADSPMTLLNTGLPGYALLWWLGHRSARDPRKQKAIGSGGVAGDPAGETSNQVSSAQA